MVQEINLKKLSFGSFFKINIVIHISLGIFIGFIGLIISIFSQNVYFNAGQFQITGIFAGLINFVFFPIVLGIMSIFLSIIAYLPFKYWIKNFGLKILSEYDSKE